MAGRSDDNVCVAINRINRVESIKSNQASFGVPPFRGKELRPNIVILQVWKHTLCVMVYTGVVLQMPVFWALSWQCNSDVLCEPVKMVVAT